jgi:hypothetical protein
MSKMEYKSRSTAPLKLVLQVSILVKQKEKGTNVNTVQYDPTGHDMLLMCTAETLAALLPEKLRRKQVYRYT